jgi:hypothetical protein
MRRNEGSAWLGWSAPVSHAGGLGCDGGKLVDLAQLAEAHATRRPEDSIRSLGLRSDTMGLDIYAEKPVSRARRSAAAKKPNVKGVAKRPTAKPVPPVDYVDALPPETQRWVRALHSLYRGK